jgi:GNAT superfamily N-acetyltransferase
VARLLDVTDPDDPRLASVARLLGEVFADPNTVLGLDRLREFLIADPAVAGRTFFVLAALPGQGEDVIGATIFSYVPRSNCGFSEYIVSRPDVRGQGIGRRLFDARKRQLDEAAQAAGHAGCNGLFIEADNPDRTPAALLEAERESGLDAHERLRLFAHLGFGRVEVNYVQPPLGPGKQAVTYLDLLFAPWRDDTQGELSSNWLVDTLAPIWAAWTPGTRPPGLPRDGRLRLLPLLPG